jgi:serine/threonine-protein kinase
MIIDELVGPTDLTSLSEDAAMAAPATMTINSQVFLAHLQQSGLVSESQFVEIRKKASALSTGPQLAHALVEQGLLTPFQADRILRGRATGFLLGPYRILDQIGRGGMGRVYKAEHRTMGRIVALKLLQPSVLSTKRATELFQHEVRAIAQLQHPNIVTAYDANEIDGRFFLVLEYVDGPNLEQLVKQQGPLSVGLACDYIRQAANGLQCAHQRKMLHRDIKPANILIQPQGGNGSPGLIKISDFGLARLAAPNSTLASQDSNHKTILAKENSVMGTPDYLSPEQSRDLHKVDIRSDLYSLGCTFYFLLTGSVPFPGGTQMDKLIRHATERPRSITEFRCDVPPPVIAIVERLLAKKPEQRYNTPAELADALAPYAVSDPMPWARNRNPLGAPEDSKRAKDSLASDVSDGEWVFGPTVLNAGDTPRPISSSNHAAHRSDVETHQRLQLALISAISVVSGGLILATLAALFGR